MKDPGKKTGRVPKGKYGYFSSEKKRRALITVSLFILPLLVLIIGIVYYKTRNNVLTVLCIVGCLPGCRSIVNLIMILKCRPMDKDLYEKIRAHQGDLVMAYEMYLTFYEKNTYIDALAVCGNEVVLYTHDQSADVQYVEQNTQKVIRKNGYKATVHLQKNLDQFLLRLDSMNAHMDSLREGIKFTPDEKYPELTREELIMHTLLALCL